MNVLLHSIQVGTPADLEGTPPLATAIYKHQVEGRVRVTTLHLKGDLQGNLSVHGGPDKAVCAYPIEHYTRWRHELDNTECGPGWFGENFTLAGLMESGACLGDVFSVGAATVQISQPRAPCSTLARRWSRGDMVKRVLEAGRTGWYFRVLHEGDVAAGDRLTLVDRPFPEWTIHRANRVKHFGEGGAAARAALAACEALSESWRASLR